jgi:hypothetical protein
MVFDFEDAFNLNLASICEGGMSPRENIQEAISVFQLEGGVGVACL